MKRFLSAGVALVSLAASSLRATTAEANLRIGTTAKMPVEAIENGLSIIQSDRQLLDEIAKRLVLAHSWKLDSDQIAERLSERISISVKRPGEALLRATDDDPSMAAILANTAASVLRDHLEKARFDHLELQEAVAKQGKAVDDKRKLLSQIIRAEGIVYQGEPPEEAVKADRDARPFVDAKGDFEKSLKEYEGLKVKTLAYQRLTIDHIRWATVAAE